MKTKYILQILTITIISFLSSCSKEEVTPFDHPFFHIHVDNQDRVSVASIRRDTIDYKVYLSAKLQFEPIDVKYEIVPGEGLEAGRDYEVVTTGNTLTFAQGIFERPISIAWKESVLDPEKNNTLTIRLLSNSKGYTIGLPGPDKIQSSLLITKVAASN